MNISLRAVDKDNFEAVTELPLLPEQVNYLASNAFSIAQASFYPHYFTRAIYTDEELVGFMMYVSMEEDGDGDAEDIGAYGIYRFMVDHRHQGKGYGRRAIELALEEIRRFDGVRRAMICYWPGNPQAKGFYASVGFVETGIDGDGEMWAQIDYTTAPFPG